MNRMNKSVAFVFGFATLICGLCGQPLSFAQSLWPFGNNQEQEKAQAQRQTHVERAFSENYWQLTEEQRALAGKQYDEYLKQPTTNPPPSQNIQKLKVPPDLFELRPRSTSPKE